MTITEPTAPTSEAIPDVHPGEPGHADAADPFGSGDHKVVGRLFIGFSLLFGVAGLGISALSSIAQLKGSTLLPEDTIFQLFVLGRVMLVFLFAVPLLLGLATYLVPLQVGASTLAFPRAAAAAFWSWLVGAAIFVVAVALNGGPTGGNARMVDLSLAGLGLVIVALLLSAVCVATTAITLRTPGMDLYRVPLFSWSMVVATGVWCLTFPVFVGNLALIFLDHKYGAGTGLAAADAQWSQLTWMFSQPQVFALAIPALGIIGDAVPTLARVRQPQRGMMMGAIGAFGFLSIGAWAQQQFNPGQYDQALYIGFGVLIGAPLLLLVTGWLLDLRRGSPRFASPVLGGFLAALLLLLGALVSLLYVIKPLQLHEINSATPEAVALWSGRYSASATPAPPYPLAQVGLLGLVVIAVAAAAIAGLFFWGPKITGSRQADGAGKLAALLLFLGGALYGIPYVLLAFANKSPGLADALDPLSVASAVGAGLAALALLVAAAALLSGLRNRNAPDDPWGVGQSLEWATSSPPPRGNFGALPEITSAEPVLDRAEAEEVS